MITLLQAATWMAPKLGLKMPRDRDEVVANLNRYRELLYSEFDEFQLFDDYEQCIKLCHFHQDCDGNTCSGYYGFTLPLDMAGVMAVWQHNEPFKLRSRWREVHVGKKLKGEGNMDIYPINGTFPTEREMTYHSKVRVWAASEQDTGKIVTIKAKMDDGSVKTLEYELAGTKHKIVNADVAAILEVVLPADQCGVIEIYQDYKDYCLSRYQPGTPVPRFRRYKVATPCPSGCVLVQGTRQFEPICEDTDLVEFGNQLSIEAAGRYFRYYESLESNEVSRSRIDKREMLDQIQGIIKRHRGRNKQDGAALSRPVQRPRRRRKGLPGYRY